jgi:hypothetical protein
MALLHKAGRTCTRARLVSRVKAGGIAPIPVTGLARCMRFLGGLFRCVFRGGVSWRKFDVGELFAL